MSRPLSDVASAGRHFLVCKHFSTVSRICSSLPSFGCSFTSSSVGAPMAYGFSASKEGGLSPEVLVFLLVQSHSDQVAQLDECVVTLGTAHDVSLLEVVEEVDYRYR